MPSDKGSKISYFMEDQREARRLADKVDAAYWVSKYLVPLELDGCRILDVGCGPGVIAAEIGKQYSRATVVGLDQSEQRLANARLNVTSLGNVSLKRGSATALPFADGTFDFVMCRFLLEYLAEKEVAVEEMVRVLKPGGRVLLQDLDGQLLWHFPRDASLQRDIECTLNLLAESGFDPFIGRKLFYLCHQAGFQNIAVQIEPYHVIVGRIDGQIRKQWEMKFEIALPLAAKALGSSDAAEQLKQRFLAYFDREDSLTYSVLFSVVGTKPDDES